MSAFSLQQVHSSIPGHSLRSLLMKCSATGLARWARDYPDLIFHSQRCACQPGRERASLKRDLTILFWGRGRDDSCPTDVNSGPLSSRYRDEIRPTGDILIKGERAGIRGKTFRLIQFSKYSTEKLSTWPVRRPQAKTAQQSRSSGKDGLALVPLLWVARTGRSPRWKCGAEESTLVNIKM